MTATNLAWAGFATALVTYYLAVAAWLTFGPPPSLADRRQGPPAVVRAAVLGAAVILGSAGFLICTS